MAKRTVCLAAICLLLCGCGIVGTSSRGTIRGSGPSIFNTSQVRESSFRQRVQNDPFPAANDVQTTNMHVQVQQ